MKLFLSIFFYIIAVLPYLTLLYKKVNIRIRLLFDSLFEIIIFFILFFIIIKINNATLITYAYSYEMIVFVTLVLNLFLILITWIISSWQKK